MGNSAVAVLHYDLVHEMKRDDRVGPDMAEAMLRFPDRERYGRISTDFHVGRVVSWDHSSGYQWTVVHGNTGWRLGDEKSPPPAEALQHLVWLLTSMGYKVTPPKPLPTRPDAGGGDE